MTTDLVTSSVHWENGRLMIYVTAFAPYSPPAVVEAAKEKARLFLGKTSRVWRVGPRRRAMTFRRAYTYAFVALSHDRAVVENWEEV